jgi:hypothetical protein
MGLSKEVDISRALDTAVTRGVSGDPIMHKLRIALQGGKEKYDGSKKKAVQVLDITRAPSAWYKILCFMCTCFN